MKAISSEEIIVPYIDEAAVAQIVDASQRQLAEIPVGIVDHVAVRVTVAAVIPDNSKYTKEVIGSTYRALVGKAEEKVWKDESGEYVFDFGDDRFQRGDVELYLTPAERLLLFRVLVNREKFYGNDRVMVMQNIRAIRHRLGGQLPAIKL